MGWLLLAILTTVEVALLVVRLRRRPSASTIIAMTRLAAFAVFVAAASGAVTWSPRYYLLGAWLAILAILGLHALLAARATPSTPGPPGPTRLVLRSAGAWTVGMVAVLPAIVFPQYRPIDPTGPRPVETSTYTVVDSTRTDPYGDGEEHRKVTYELWSPRRAAGTHPLIAFSHGAFGTRSSNRSMFADLASHGYVVASIDHTHHALYASDQHGERNLINSRYLRQVRSEDATADPVASHRLYREWMDVRVADIGAVLDHLLEESERSGAPDGARVDPGRIGVIGHSLGGSAALEVGRTRPDVGAVVALEAPFMGDIDGVVDGAFTWRTDPYPTPLLNIYSDTSWNRLDEWPQYAKNAELLAAPGHDVFNVHQEGVGHLGLTDLAMASPLLTRILNGHSSSADARESLMELNSLTLRFFDTYLRGSGSFDG